MAKVTSEKKYLSFVKGLITEATALTFPENASLDEDNFDLKSNGSRLRRLGVDYEAGYVSTSTGLSATKVESTRKSFHKWDFPGGATDVSIGVVRVYNRLWFFNLLAESPSSAILNGGTYITVSGLLNSEVEITTINNYLVLVSTDITYPVLLKYNKDTQLVTQENIPVQVRDTWGVSDGLKVKQRPSSLSDAHEYNLINQGWVDTISSVCASGEVSTGNSSSVWVIGEGDSFWEEGVDFYTPSPVAILCTKSTLGVYPSNSDVWTLGKIGSSLDANFEKYSPEALAKNSVNNMEAPRGSNIIEAFRRGYSRRKLSNFSTLPLDQENGRFSTVATYAGRIFYSGVVSSVTSGDAKSPNYSGYVFFSQIVTGKSELAKCYQEADPTSPEISDLVDTDGGTIYFPEITKVTRLVQVKDSLLVFAENGIWEIFGDVEGFKATSYQVAKVSTTGIANPDAIVSAGSSVVYWAKSGIYVVTPNPQTGRYEETNISLSTIQTFYNSIPALSAKNARGFFDSRDNHIRWMYNDSDNYTDGVNINEYNRILNLDLTLKSFYKYSISPLTANSPMISDFIDIPAYALENTNENVYSDSSNVLVGTDQVLVPSTTSIHRTGKYSFLTFIGTSFTFSKFFNQDFIDWESADSVGVDYSSYLITGHEIYDDVVRKKQTPYAWFYLNRTETGFTTDGTDLFPINPSSCLVQARWDWSNSDIQGKWGTQFQAYRYLRRYSPTGTSDTFDTGDSIIVTKNVIRGTGKALSLKIESEAGKDLQLLGWATIVTGTGTP